MPLPPVVKRMIASLSAVIALLVTACTAEIDGEPRRHPGIASSTTDSAGQTRRPSNVPMKKLTPGERPPQFILFSFDGVGVGENWDLFLDVSKETDSRFTALMTGVYFLTDAARKKYRGPGHRPGESSIAFGGTKAEVVEHVKGPKIRIHKFKNKTGYHKRQGHRQRLTVVKVTAIA